jgi:hypothetical protein
LRPSSALTGTSSGWLNNLERRQKIVRIEHCDFPARVIEALLRKEANNINTFLESDRSVLLV